MSDAKATRHIGADIPSEIAEQFRAQCEMRGFKQIKLIRLFIEDWLVTPEPVQIDFYHRRAMKESAFRDRVENLLRELSILPKGKPNDARAKGTKVG